MAQKSTHQTIAMLVLLTSCSVIAAFLHLNTKYSLLAKLDGVGSDCFATGPSSVLSLHMVIIPFLGYTTSAQRILQRLEEYKYVLQKNLAHPLVQCIHVLTTNSTETLQLFNGLSNLNKMLVSEVRSIDLTRDPYQYVSHSLLGRDVLVTNADIYLGEGFELVDPTIMDGEKIMYAVTRRLAPVECYGDELNDPRWNCKRYIGSHDAYLFRLHESLPEKFLQQLEFDYSVLGSEDVIIDLFEELGYCVLNPCAVLETFHYHCSNLRNKEGKPTVSPIGKAHTDFTNKLKCSI